MLHLGALFIKKKQSQYVCLFLAVDATGVGYDGIYISGVEGVDVDSLY